MRVLVVEDEPELAAFLGRTLREAAWAPDSVTTGEGALEALAVNAYDLVILDLGLPDLEGFEVCRRWRAQGGRLRFSCSPPETCSRIGCAVSTPGRRLSPQALRRGGAVGAAPGFGAPARRDTAGDAQLRGSRAGHRRPHRASAGPRDPAHRAGVRPARVSHAQSQPGARPRPHPRHVWDDNFDLVANAVDVLVGRVRRKVDPDGEHPSSSPCGAWATCLAPAVRSVPLSRLRLRLSAWFALAFVAGLTALSLTLYAYLRHQSSLRLTRSLRTSAVELVDAIRFELREAPPPVSRMRSVRRWWNGRRVRGPSPSMGRTGSDSESVAARPRCSLFPPCWLPATRPRPTSGRESIRCGR